MVTTRKLFWIIAVPFLVYGCTHHHVPDPYHYEISIANDFSSTSSISLENVQTSTEDVLFATMGPHKFYANLQRWTEAAITLTRKELVKRGMKVDENAAKILKLSINSVKTIPYTWVFHCETTLEVETGDGYKKTYLGQSEISGVTFQIAYVTADNSVTHAVTEMLEDPQITNYLTK